MNQQINKTGWQGFLSFTFVAGETKTVVKDKKHLGPLVMQRPYYPEKNRPSVLILHPPGGVVGGDSLEVAVLLRPQAKGMISTPAATKFYRSAGPLATQTQTLHLTEQTQLEWLPQETLFFNHARVKNRLKFVLDSTQNSLIAWDIVGFGRPASGEGFESGHLQQSLEVWVEGKLVFLDRLQLSPEVGTLQSASGLAEHTLFATALFYSDDTALQKTLLQDLQAVEQSCPVGVTQLGSLIVMRVLASKLDEMKSILFAAWSLARPSIMGVPALKPRIWNT